jgi:hypothetical protein
MNFPNARRPNNALQATASLRSAPPERRYMDRVD